MEGIKKQGKNTKKKEEKSDKTEKKIDSKNYNFWIYTVIAIVLIFILCYVSYSTFVFGRQFNYAGLKFEKVKIGELVFYQTEIPLYSKDPVTGQQVNSVNFSIMFRNDPRILENISIKGILKLKSKVILAAEGLECEDNGIAGGELGQVLGRWTKVKIGTTNETLAKEMEIPHAICDPKIRYLDSSVLIFKKGNVTEINQIGGRDCYEVSVADCQILGATERFIIGLYAHSRGIPI